MSDENSLTKKAVNTLEWLNSLSDEELKQMLENHQESYLGETVMRAISVSDRHDKLELALAFAKGILIIIGGKVGDPERTAKDALQKIEGILKP